MAKAFLVVLDGAIINKIIPDNQDVTIKDLKEFYSDPSFDIHEFADSNDPLFVNSNDTFVAPQSTPTEAPNA